MVELDVKGNMEEDPRPESHEAVDSEPDMQGSVIESLETLDEESVSEALAGEPDTEGSVRRRRPHAASSCRMYQYVSSCNMINLGSYRYATFVHH